MAVARLACSSAALVDQVVRAILEVLLLVLLVPTAVLEVLLLAVLLLVPFPRETLVAHHLDLLVVVVPALAIQPVHLHLVPVLREAVRLHT